jgi:hypothetical protein
VKSQLVSRHDAAVWLSSSLDRDTDSDELSSQKASPFPRKVDRSTWIGPPSLPSIAVALLTNSDRFTTTWGLAELCGKPDESTAIPLLRNVTPSTVNFFTSRPSPGSPGTVWTPTSQPSMVPSRTDNVPAPATETAAPVLVEPPRRW